jgi:hypothetical protein
MKKLLLTLTVFAGFTATAQVYYNASAAADFQLGGIQEVDGDTNNWQILDITTFPVTQVQPFGECLASSSFDNVNEIPLTPDNIYFTPRIDLTGATGTINLTWKAVSPETDASGWYQEYYSVYVFDGFANAPAAFAAAPLHSAALTAGQQIFNFSYPVSSFAGVDSLIVAFRHHNCTDENYLFIDDIRVAGTAGINENVISASVYPNPTKDVINFEVTGEIATVEITTLDGKSVLTATDKTVQVAELRTGLYLYTITTAEGKIAKGTFAKN